MLQRAVLNNKKIEVQWNTVVDEFLGTDEGLRAAKLRDTVTGETRELPVDGAFVAIGHTPNTGLFAGQLDMDGAGYLRTVNRTTRTSVEGVFAAGDVADHQYRQAVTSAGTGSMAALDAERWLSEHGEGDVDLDDVSNLCLPDYATWRVKMLKQELDERGVSTSGCVEKGDFVERLMDWHGKNPTL